MIVIQCKGSHQKKYPIHLGHSFVQQNHMTYIESEYVGECLRRYGWHWQALTSIWVCWLDTGRAFHEAQCHRHQRGINKCSTADVKSPAEEFGHLRHLFLNGHYEGDESADTKCNWENRNTLVNTQYDIVCSFHGLIMQATATYGIKHNSMWFSRNTV